MPTLTTNRRDGSLISKKRCRRCPSEPAGPSGQYPRPLGRVNQSCRWSCRRIPPAESSSSPVESLQSQRLHESQAPPPPRLCTVNPPLPAPGFDSRFDHLATLPRHRETGAPAISSHVFDSRVSVVLAGFAARLPIFRIARTPTRPLVLSRTSIQPRAGRSRQWRGCPSRTPCIHGIDPPHRHGRAFDLAGSAGRVLAQGRAGRPDGKIPEPGYTGRARRAPRGR